MIRSIPKEPSLDQGAPYHFCGNHHLWYLKAYKEYRKSLDQYKEDMHRVADWQISGYCGWLVLGVQIFHVKQQPLYKAVEKCKRTDKDFVPTHYEEV